MRLLAALLIGTALLNATQIARKACHLRGRKSATDRLIFTGAMKKARAVNLASSLAKTAGYCVLLQVHWRDSVYK